MQVDKARRNNEPGRVDRLTTANVVLGDDRDRAVRNTDVTYRIQPLFPDP